MRQSRERVSLNRLGWSPRLTRRLVSASTPFALPLGPGLLKRFPPATAEDGASSREPINDAPHQPKDSLQRSAGLLETLSDVSALVLASHRPKNETKIGITFFF